MSSAEEQRSLGESWGRVAALHRADRRDEAAALADDLFARARELQARARVPLESFPVVAEKARTPDPRVAKRVYRELMMLGRELRAVDKERAALMKAMRERGVK